MKTFFIIYFSFGAGCLAGGVFMALLREAAEDAAERKRKGWL